MSDDVLAGIAKPVMLVTAGGKQTECLLLGTWDARVGLMVEAYALVRTADGQVRLGGKFSDLSVRKQYCTEWFAPNEIIFRSYFPNDHMHDPLVAQGVITDTGSVAQVGYAICPIVRIDTAYLAHPDMVRVLLVDDDEPDDDGLPEYYEPEAVETGSYGTKF